MTLASKKETLLDFVLKTLMEQGLTPKALLENDIRESEIRPSLAWETACKLAKLLGSDPGYWMQMAYESSFSP